MAGASTDPVPDEYRAALRHLFGLRRFGLRPGLETIQALLRGLGDPQERFRSIHITGSKGKGSTAAMAESILRAAGRRTGLFTSPHLVTYRERIRVGGEPIGPAEVVEGLRRVDDAVEKLRRAGRLDREPTFFEVTTALGLDHFARSGVSDAVVEVGIGGRLDATNVLRSPVAVITTVELEHTDLLGPSLADIGREKSGILHAGQHAVVGRLPPAARAEVGRKAHAVGIPAWHLEEEIRLEERSLDATGQRFTVRHPLRSFERLRLPLAGTFQPGNAALAVTAADRFAAAEGFRLTDRAIRSGLRGTVWRGRLERLDTRPDLFLDVGHTPESARAVAASLAEIAPFAVPEESAILFGCLGEKRVGEILETLSPLAGTLVVVPVASSRSARPEELRRAAGGRFARIVQAPSSSEGLRLARAATGEGGLTLAIGSDYLVGEILREREGAGIEEPDLSDPGVATDDPGAVAPALDR